MTSSENVYDEMIISSSEDIDKHSNTFSIDIDHQQEGNIYDSDDDVVVSNVCLGSISEVTFKELSFDASCCGLSDNKSNYKNNMTVSDSNNNNDEKDNELILKKERSNSGTGLQKDPSALTLEADRKKSIYCFDQVAVAISSLDTDENWKRYIDR
eukprot:Pgem_evm1s13607